MKKQTKGILLMLFSSFSFALMNIFVRLAGDLPSIQKAFFRNLIAFFIALVVLCREKTPYRIPKGQRRHMLGRCAAGLLGVICNYYAVDRMVISDATMLNKMSPFFVILFSVWLLKERATKRQLLFSCMGAAGCVLILKPSLSGLISASAAVALLGGIAAGFAYTEVRVLGVHNVDKNVIVLSFSGFSCLAILPVLAATYEPMTAQQVICLLLAGAAAAGGQFGVTAAYCYLPGAQISVYDYSTVLFAAILGFVFFSQIPDVYSVLGYVIICAAGILMTLYGKQETSKNQ